MSLMKPEVGLLNKSSCLTAALEPGLLTKGSRLARALGVTKFTNDRDMILVTLCFLSLTWMFNKPVLGVTEFVAIIAMNLFTLCCAT
jgi:hypothetical protein